MKSAAAMKSGSELDQLCAAVRAFVIEGAYEIGIASVCRAMEQFPHAPQPHNLLGIILEKTGKHAEAMRHFRAAWALDPTYLPANHNLNIYGTFYSNGICAFDESDVPAASAGSTGTRRESRGIGYGIRR